MRKPPEMLVMLAPAALVTAVVVSFGLVADPSDPGEPERRATIRAGATSSPRSVESPQALDLPPGKLVGPSTTLAAEPRPEFKVHQPFSFTIASYNVLGHSHTVSGGTKARYAGSGIRTAWALGSLQGQSVDIVGLQEFQAPQYHAFMGRAGGSWDAYPGIAGGHLGVENSIAWREDTFELVEGKTVSIPYFGGRPRNMPYVQLKHKATGQKLWVANFHNPATTSRHGNNFRWRRAATSRQIALANELAESKYPVFFTGDMNERMEYCAPLTNGTDLKSAHGEGSGTPCGSPRGMQVDWIFGSEQVQFSGYRVLDGGIINRTSDHPLVVSNVTVPEFKEKIVYKNPAPAG